jgi:hypothetical protein
VLYEDTRARRFVVAAFLPVVSSLVAWVALDPHWYAVPAVVVALVGAAEVSGRCTSPGSLLRYSLWIVALGYLAVMLTIVSVGVGLGP